MKVEVIYENGETKIIETKEKKFDDFIIKNESSMIEKGIKTYNFIYPTEGLNELLGIRKVCDTCRNFYIQPIMGGGKCKIQNNKGEVVKVVQGKGRSPSKYRLGKTNLD